MSLHPSLTIISMFLPVSKCSLMVFYVPTSYSMSLLYAFLPHNFIPCYFVTCLVKLFHVTLCLSFIPCWPDSCHLIFSHSSYHLALFFCVCIDQYLQVKCSSSSHTKWYFRNIAISLICYFSCIENNRIVNYVATVNAQLPYTTHKKNKNMPGLGY